MRPLFRQFPLFRASAKRFLSDSTRSKGPGAGPAPDWTTQLARNRGKVLFGIGAVGSVAVYETSDPVHEFVNHVYFTTERVGVVAQATIRCFYHYKKALGKQYQDEKERFEALGRCHKQCAEITLHALSTNGGIFIKFGQHIGAMTYLLPPEWTETMVPLQDRCPESTLEDIDEMFVQDTGRSLEEQFRDIDPRPIGVASLAQVYTARLRSTGQKVAVKCQHPELKEFVPVDVVLTQTVFALMDRVFPEYPLTWLGDELQSSIYTELDFTKEAENARNTQEYFRDYSRVTALRVPNVVLALPRILVMEYVAGERLDNLEYIDSHGISRADVSACLSHIFNNMIFTPDVGLHCDPHGGNLAIRAVTPTVQNPHNFEIVLFDHGLYRFPETQLRRDYAHFWLALLDRDRAGMQYYAERFANVTPEQFPLFAAAITGRSIDVALNYDIASERSDAEIRDMTDRFVNGEFLPDLMAILSRIPRVVLLILKTNDLTRHLDETLRSPLGPARTFLIMTQYAARTVYWEAAEEADKRHRRWSLWWLAARVCCWLRYERRLNQLYLYDAVLWCKQLWRGIEAAGATL